MTLRPAILTLGLATALLTPAFAQKATPEQMGRKAGNPEFATLHLTCGLGSFKTRPKNPVGFVEGRMEITFTGSILVNGLKGNIEVSPGLSKEFDDLGRQIYHGTGRLVVDGEWRGLQWFGSDMQAVWYGSGLISLVGEFDKNLNTGEFWFDDPTAKGIWNSHMTTVQLPEQRLGVTPGVVPTRKGEGGN